MDNNVILSLVILIVIFLVFRDLVCWYWKINYQVKLLEEIRNELKKLNKVNQISDA